jgi:hypothetical protein
VRISTASAPTLREFLPDPSHLQDMDKAAIRIAQAIRNREAVAVYGDYDVDGATSAALLIRLFACVAMMRVITSPTACWRAMAHRRGIGASGSGGRTARRHGRLRGYGA